jgi:methionyl-tRNA formyltransferase
VPQDSQHATYAAKISKSEALIDWTRSALHICRQVRAFNPAPGAATSLNGAALKVWKATQTRGTGALPGTIVRSDAGGIVVTAGEDAVQITELQKAGGKRLNAAAFLAGATLTAGARLGT